MVVAIRTPQELDLMRKSGEITAKALKKVIQAVGAGMSLIVLDKIAEEEILRLGGGSSFKTVEGYYWTSCLTVNDEVVHGIPRNIILKEGDVLGIDLGAVYKGWHTDAAWSVFISEKGKEKREEDGEKQRFLKVGEETLWKAVEQAVEGNRIGDISATIQENIESAGYSVVRSMIGHGVGKLPHEDPEIPGVGKKGSGLKLKAGMSLAVEVIYTAGGFELYHKNDGWTVATKDGSWGGLFEMSAIVGKEKAEVITDWRMV